MMNYFCIWTYIMDFYGCYFPGKKVVVILLCPWKMAFSFSLTEWLSLSF